jgi:hypothetical protein
MPALMRPFRGKTASGIFAVSNGKSKRAAHHRTTSASENEMSAAQHRTTKVEFTEFLRRRRRFRSGKFFPVSRHGTRHLLSGDNTVTLVWSVSPRQFIVVVRFVFQRQSVDNDLVSLYTSDSFRFFAMVDGLRSHAVA